MIANGTHSEPSFFSRAWDFSKSYLKNVGSTYLEFAVPVALFLVFNASVEAQLRDNERIGLLWLNYTQVESDTVRENKFPAHQPGTRQQERRNTAAKAAESAVKA